MSSDGSLWDRVVLAVKSNGECKSLYKILKDKITEFPDFGTFDHWRKIEKKFLSRNFSVEHFIPGYAKEKAFVALR